MNTFAGTLKKILFVAVLSLLTFSTASANEPDSIYLYNALENKASFEEMLANKDIALLLEEDESLEKALPQSVRTNPFSKKSQLIDPAEFEIALKELIAKQNSTIEKAQKAMDKISNKSELASTLLGNGLGTLEFELVQIKGLQALFNSLIPKTTNVSTKVEIRERIENLKVEQDKIELLLNEKEGSFSFLGWLVATL